MKMPTNFDELEKYNEGHTRALECFHNLDVVLHHSALLFFEKASLKMGKLSNNSNQKNAVYKLPSDENNEVDYGFVENFCRLFDLRDRLRKMRAEIEEKEYTTKYTSLSGNHIFNATVCIKCSIFEKLFVPVVQELNEGDR